ncbi:MAG: GFA family protein [Deltaproteobacteria bacterium]
MNRHSATCLCGACELRVSVGPLLVTLDSAPESQTLACAPFRWAAYFAESEIKTMGTYLPYRHVLNDQAAETYWRCATCGTQMWFRAHNTMPGTVGVNAAAFGQPGSFAPTQAVHARTRPVWVQLDGAITDTD